MGLPRHPAAAQPTLFSFGYWGSGSATPALVSAVEQAEAMRGFGPPLWVDIRISRAVRAAGFRERAFERLLGAQYAWMPDLGNLCVQERRAGIRIARPGAAEELLDRALSAPTRRAIFFCSCALPRGCHRYVVAALVKQSASSRGLNVSVVEWPGGEPLRISLSVLPQLFSSVSRGTQRSLPLPSDMTVGAAASLPWASSATLESGERFASVLVGPATFSGRGAHLPIFPEVPVDEAASFRELRGYGYHRQE